MKNSDLLKISGALAMINSKLDNLNKFEVNGGVGQMNGENSIGNLNIDKFISVLKTLIPYKTVKYYTSFNIILIIYFIVSSLIIFLYLFELNYTFYIILFLLFTNATAIVSYANSKTIAFYENADFILINEQRIDKNKFYIEKKGLLITLIEKDSNVPKIKMYFFKKEDADFFELEY